MNVLPAQLPPSTGASFLTQLEAERRPMSSEQIAQTARDFESIFVTMLLKQMRQTLEPGALFGGDSADANGALFDMFMSKHLSEAGGLGLAPMIQKQLESTS